MCDASYMRNNHVLFPKAAWVPSTQPITWGNPGFSKRQLVAFKTFFSGGEIIKDGPIFSLIKVQTSYFTHPTEHLAISKKLAVFFIEPWFFK